MAGEAATVVRHGTVVPMTGRSWRSADILIEGSRISSIGPGLDVPPGARVLDASDALVLPGFVQTHVHVVQSLARHRAEGRSLREWLGERVWPYEAALSPDEVAAAARLGVAELLCTGTTTALDMGTTHGQDRVFGAAAELGIRFTSGKTHMDVGDGVPAGLLEDTDASLAEADLLAGRWHGASGGRLRYAIAPRFVLSCSERLVRGCVELAARHGCLLHTHSSENPDEIRYVRETTGRGNVRFLSDQGVGGDRTVLAHCVHLDEEEVALLAREGTGVAHCPGANLKLASGIADVPRLLAAGVRVGLGADGPPCNNRLSVFHEMALAGTLHNLRGGPRALDSWTVLEMATWRGASLLGLDGEIGRLEPGRRADLVVLGLDSWGMEPAGDPAVTVVLGGGPHAVRHVVVDGTTVVENRNLLTGDARAIVAGARAAATGVACRLGWS